MRGTLKAACWGALAGWVVTILLQIFYPFFLTGVELLLPPLASGAVGVVVGWIAVLLRGFARRPTSSRRLRSGKRILRWNLGALIIAILLAGLNVWRTDWTVAPRILLVGLDAATWPVIEPLREAGELPALDSLIRQGTSGELRSTEPSYSPVVWTTIASGVPPEVHGITGFYSTQAQLRVKRVWEIFSELGLSVGVFRWWASWPPREVNGFLIPGILAQGPEAYPEEYAFVNQLRISQRAGQKSGLLGWAGYLADYLDHGLRFSTGRRVLFELAPAILGRDRGQMHIVKRRAELRLNFDVYTHMLRTSRPEYTSFYDNGIDVLGHYYWKYFQPEAFPDIEDREIARYGAALPDYYRLVDDLLAELLARIDPRSTVLVLSDHGMRAAEGYGSDELIPLVDRVLTDLEWSDRYFGIVLANRTFIESKRTDAARAEREIAEAATALRQMTIAETGLPAFEVRVIDEQRIGIELAIAPRVEPAQHVVADAATFPISSWLSQRPGKSGDHHPRGILIARGPGVRSGETIEGATILDVAPTLLALARAPIADDMPGRVLAEVLTPAYLAANPPRTIPTYGAVDPESEEITMDAETEKALRALGYVQ